MRLRCVLISLVVPLALASGCTSVWEENFRPNALVPTTAPPTTHVDLREVPWQRIDATLSALNQEFVASPISPVDWPPERKEAAQAQLLSGLQVQWRQPQPQILGSSRFRSTQPLRADDPALAAFGRRIGATLIVWSATYLGKADRVQSEPVTSFTWFNGGDPWYTGGSAQSTSWVPVVVQADEYAWLVYFVRR